MEDSLIHRPSSSAPPHLVFCLETFIYEEQESEDKVCVSPATRAFCSAHTQVVPTRELACSFVTSSRGRALAWFHGPCSVHQL